MAAHRRPVSWSPDVPSIIAAILVGIVGIVLLTIGGINYATTGSVSFHPAITAPAPVSAPAVIDEDSPLWDCATMGNRTCGDGQIVDGIDTTAAFLPDAVVQPDGTLRLSCRAYEDLVSSDGSESADSMVCRAV